MTQPDTPVSGGCQCGAVRYRCDTLLDDAHLCHCRMCQKAVGGPFAALIGAPRAAITWTRGTPARFRSSEKIDRGFCANCGTPLFYEDVTGDHVSFTIGSLDTPGLFPPRTNDCTDTMVPWFPTVLTIPDSGPARSDDSADWADAILNSSKQHPDHDTTNW